MLSLILAWKLEPTQARTIKKAHESALANNLESVHIKSTPKIKAKVITEK